MRKYYVFTVKVPLGSQSEHSAAEGREETVSLSGLPAYTPPHPTTPSHPAPGGGRVVSYGADPLFWGGRGPERAPPKKCERGDGAKVLCFYSQSAS